MAVGLAPNNVRDLVNSLQIKVRKPFTETLRDSHRYLVKMTFGGKTEPFTGSRVEQPVSIGDGSGGVFVNLYQGTPAALLDGLIRYGVDPSFYVNKNVVFDEKARELNSGPQAVVPYYENILSMAYRKIADNLEDSLSGVPSNAADTKRFFGPRFWFPETKVGVTDYVGGHIGDTITYLDGTTSTTIGGADRSLAQNARIRSWQANYVNVDAMFIKTFRRGVFDTDFSAVDGLEGELPKMQNSIALCPKSVAEDLEDLVNRGPDDLDGELARFKLPRIRGINIQPLSTYDRYTTLPIQVINRSTWKAFVVGGKWMKRNPAINMENSHDVWIVPIDCHGNAMPTDIRAGGFTISKAR